MIIRFYTKDRSITINHIMSYLLAFKTSSVELTQVNKKELYAWRKGYANVCVEATASKHMGFNKNGMEWFGLNFVKILLSISQC